MYNIARTVSFIVERLDLLFLAAVKSILDVPDAIGRRQRTVQEVTGAWMLHNLSTTVAGQIAEAVVAEDDRLVLNLSVGDDEVSICRIKRKTTTTTFRVTSNISSHGAGAPTRETQTHQK
jgi:hypothetical protein